LSRRHSGKIERRAEELGDHKSRLLPERPGFRWRRWDAFVKRYAAAAAKKAAKLDAETRRRFMRMAKRWSSADEAAYISSRPCKGIWILHMIASCYAGARDYGFGRIDQYYCLFTKKDLATGLLSGGGLTPCWPSF